MPKIIIIISEKGDYEKLLTDTDLDLAVLKRGVDDAKIDRAEGELDEHEC